MEENSKVVFKIEGFQILNMKNQKSFKRRFLISIISRH